MHLDGIQGLINEFQSFIIYHTELPQLCLCVIRKHHQRYNIIMYTGLQYITDVNVILCL